MKHAGALVVEPIGADLVALAQCHALDASVFPHPSMVAVHAASPPSVWIGRVAAGAAVAGFLAAWTRGGTLEIVGLAVAPEHRGVGLGRALLRAAVASAEGRQLSAVRLHVSTANGPALELYVDEGFAVVGRKRRFYSPADFPHDGDAYEMVLRLTGIP